MYLNGPSVFIIPLTQQYCVGVTGVPGVVGVGIGVIGVGVGVVPVTVASLL